MMHDDAMMMVFETDDDDRRDPSPPPTTHASRLTDAAASRSIESQACANVGARGLQQWLDTLLGSLDSKRASDDGHPRTTRPPGAVF